MSMPEAIFHQPRSVPLPRRAVAYAAVGAARLLAANRRADPPSWAGSTQGPPATFEQAKAARDTVVAVSLHCAAREGCVARSLATVLLCRLSGRWATWCVGARRMPPFGAHAWVEAEGRPVGRTTRPTTSAPSSPCPDGRDRPDGASGRRRGAGGGSPARQAAGNPPGGCCWPTSAPTAGRCSAAVCSASWAAWPRWPTAGREAGDRQPGTGQSPLGPVVLLTVLTIGGALLTAAGNYVLGRTAESVVLTARQRLISQLLRLRVGALDRLKPGDLLAQVTSDTTLLRSVSTYGLVNSVNAAFMLVASVVLMGMIDMVLLAVTLAVLALNWLAVLVVVPRIRRATERTGGRRRHGVGAGAVAGIVPDREGDGRRGAPDPDRPRRPAGVAAGRRGGRLDGAHGGLAGLAVQISFLAVLGVGGARVASRTLPVSSLIAFLLYLLLLGEPITALVNGVSQLQAGLAAVVRLQEVQALPVEPKPVRRQPPSPFWPAVPAPVACRDVWFRYGTGDEPLGPPRPLLRAARRRMTAIVGAVGTGKTTLFALLELLRAQSGTVVDGRDVRDGPAGAARRHRPRRPGGQCPRRDPAGQPAAGRPGASDDDLDGAHPHPPGRPGRPARPTSWTQRSATEASPSPAVSVGASPSPGRC